MQERSRSKKDDDGKANGANFINETKYGLIARAICCFGSF